MVQPKKRIEEGSISLKRKKEAGAGNEHRERSGVKTKRKLGKEPSKKIREEKKKKTRVRYIQPPKMTISTIHSFPFPDRGVCFGVR